MLRVLLIISTASVLAAARRMAGPMMVDLSYAFDKSTLYPKEAGNFTLDVRHGKTKYGVRYQEEIFMAPTEGGTCMITPRLLMKGRWSIMDIPLNRLVAAGVVIDVSLQVMRNRNYQLLTSDVLRWEDIHGKLPQGCILLIRTGWSRYWPSWKKYHGLGNVTYDVPHHPGIHPDTATWLISKRKLYGVGIDGPSLDYGMSKNLGAQHVFLAANTYGLLNVANMKELPSAGFTMFVFPMKIRGASASPVRILAVVP
ncbi:isatin hydrolase-like [Ornithodoros turicata]|uniref:isatin hydrolase-like n=1 Tax=Ornithodoros turicata TaxID=34597 RepID=UPI003139EF36